MSTEQNKAIVRLVWDVLNGGNAEKLEALYSPDVIYCGPGGHEIKGIQKLKQFFNYVRTALHDVHFTVDDLIAEGDKVVTVWTMKATTKNNKPIIHKGIIVSRLVDNKVVEDFEVFDRFAMAEQAAPNWLAKMMVNSMKKQMEKGRP